MVPICKDCKHYSRQHPTDKRVDPEHWCGIGINLLDGEREWISCQKSRYSQAPFIDSWSGGVYEPCGHQGTFFEESEETAIRRRDEVLGRYRRAVVMGPRDW